MTGGCVLNILIASSIDPGAIEELKRHHDVVCAFGASEDELTKVIEDREAIVFRSGVQINENVMSRAPGLKLLIRAGSGLDNLDVEYAQKRGLDIERIPGPGARAVAELTFANMLSLARQLPILDSGLRQGHWLKHKTTGYLLRGKTLGIVGMGNIGCTVAEMARSWDMKVVGCVERRSESRAKELSNKGFLLSSFDEVVERADFLSLHVPRKPSTIGMINDQVLSRMRPGAFLVNLARGGVVDEPALLRALTEGRLAGAALDVHQNEGEGHISPLAELPNVILTPHIGAETIDTQREIGQTVLDIIERWH